MLLIFVSAKINSISHKNQGSKIIIANIESRIQSLIEATNSQPYPETALSPATSEAVELVEHSFLKLACELADWMSALRIQKAIESDQMLSEVKEFVKRLPGRYKNYGWRTVNIRFSGGTVIPIKAAYYARNCDKNKRNKGFYPALCLLGIHDRCTPGLISEVSLLSAALCSLEEAKKMLDSRGISLNIKTIRNIVKRFAARARLAQENDVSLVNDDAETVKGRKVVVSADGGRVRIRTDKRGPKSKKGRSRYKTDWKEPKLLIIYITNEEGKQDKKFSPYIDGTLKGPDAIYAMLAYYLKRIGVKCADKVLFVSDGARWIWERIPKLISTLGLDTNKVYELIDFYHAVQHLTNLAKLQSTWSSTTREKWVRKNRRLLKKGRVKQVIADIIGICKGSRKKLVKREREYFVKNQHRMNYQAVSNLKLPIGSGAIESSIRRVINLRMKSPCIFWHEDTANEMLMLRSYYKAGRWDTLKAWSESVAA